MWRRPPGARLFPYTTLFRSTRRRWRRRRRKRRWPRRWRPWRPPMMTGTRLVTLLSLALLPVTTRAQEHFPSPEAAARALDAGARATSPERLAAVLGPGSEEIVSSGDPVADASARDRKSTRLNSSHVKISYAVFCLKK